ncbi:MAG: nitrilase-related carbon-nitrogen hydrolase [Anaerolineae bacterium]
MSAGVLGRLLPAAAAALRLRVNPDAIRRQVERMVAHTAPPADGASVRVGVVQWEGRLERHVADYTAHAVDAALRAVADGAQLLVFPEDTGSYPLAGLIPGIAGLVSGGVGEPAAAVQGGDAPVLALFRVLAPVARRAHEAVFATLARACGAHILAGSTLALEGECVFKEARLYGPDGSLLLTQRKMNLTPTEEHWGLSRGGSVQVARTPVGVLATPVCMDHTYYETARSAWLQGAEILIDPAADPNPYNPWLQARGVWARVQESLAYGIHALMVGSILGNVFGGRSGVYAPLAMTPRGDGVLAQARTGDAEEVLCATLDLRAVRAFRHTCGLELNLPLYRKYVPDLYEAAPAGASGKRRVDS